MNALSPREIYRTSRLLDFASERELTAQIGHPSGQWLEVALKELFDNALDAAEEAGIPPVISVRVDGRVLEVADEGPGIPDDVIRDVLDFTVRVSSREAYVGPTRGAQGNALKTIVAMPFAIDGKAGLIEIEAHGTLHRITFAVDPIEQAPVARHERLPSPRTIGSVVRLHWPEPIDSASVADLVVDFHMLNPHLRVHLGVGGGVPSEYLPTKPGWTRWRPSDPEPASWYTVERLERRIAAAIHRDRMHGVPVRTVRAFIATFQNLSSTARQKQVLDCLELQRASLEDAFVTPSGELDRTQIARLLFAMQAYDKPVRPRRFGETGLPHLKRRSAGDQVIYKRIEIEDAHLPVLCEAALILLDRYERRLVTVGINNSPALAGGDAYPGLWWVLDRATVAADDPVWFYLHLAGPRFDFLDRGKSHLSLPVAVRRHIDAEITRLLEPWRKYKKRKEREEKAERRLETRMKPEQPPTLIEAADRVIPGAYLKASDNGRLKVRPRQIGYAAREEIQELTGRPLDLKYFTQDLFPGFVSRHPDLTKSWDITWDARGSLIEPHTGRVVPLGTAEVEDWQAGWGSRFIGGESACGWWKTSGPLDRFGAVLFIEKEGFTPLFAQVELAERFDIALMSTKGLSTTTARKLIDHLIGEMRMPVYVVRDFDVSGFKIAGTLARDTERYRWTSTGAIDLGLRLADVELEGLASERVFYETRDKKTEKKRVLEPDDPRDREKILAQIGNQIRTNGGTEEEVEFLVTHRVELNAFTSRGLVGWLERKLEAAGVRKVVPSPETLGAAALGFAQDAVIARLIAGQRDAVVREAEALIGGIDLEREVHRLIGADPRLSWDGVVRRLVNGGGEP